MGVFVREHPERAVLFEYAEQLEKGGGPILSETADHVGSCTLCAAEVRSMRKSIALTQRVKSLEPTSSLQASVILAMKAERLEQRRQKRRRMMKSMAFAAGFALLLGISVQTTPGRNMSPGVKIGPEVSVARSGVAIESLKRPTPDEALLGPALDSSSWQPGSAWEAAQRRTLDAMDADINEALAALQSNPALVRASAVITSNREFKRQTLKTLYAQRIL